MSSAGGPNDEETPPEHPRGTVRTTGAGPLAIAAVLGLVAGWSLRWVALHTGIAEPGVGWTPILLVWFVAIILAVVAYLTWQTVRGSRGRLPAHQAVNRLALGKSCALVGALLAGGFGGYAVAQLGVAGSEMAGTRLWHSLLAGLGAVAVTVAALLLQRACRVPDDEDPSPTL